MVCKNGAEGKSAVWAQAPSEPLPLICTPTLVLGSESTWSSEARGSLPLVEPNLQRR